jgi:PAS domain S-box-containing protein
VTFIIQTPEATDETTHHTITGSSTGIEKAYDFFNQAPVIIGFLKGDNYIIEMANDGLLEVWGRTSEVIGKPLLTAIPELEAQGLTLLLEQVRKTGEPFYAYEFPITLMRNGKEEILYFNFVYKAFYEGESEGIADGVISVGYDVTPQVLANKKMEESEAKYRSLFDTMDQGFCVLDIIFDDKNNPIDYRFLEANIVFEKQTGLANAIGKTAREMIPNLEPHWFDLYGKVALSGKSTRFTEGSEAMGRWFDVYAFRFGDTGSKKVAVLFSDVTEQKKVEQTIRETEERFRNLADESPIFVFLIDASPEAPVSYWNKTWLQYTGVPLNEAIGTAWSGVLHPDDIPAVLDIYVPAFEKKQPYILPAVRIKRHDGVYRWYAFKANPRYLPNGEFNGYVGVGFDIHEQKLSEEKIKESEAQLQIKVAERTLELENQKNLFDNILTNSSNGISVTKMIRDDKGKVVDAKTIMANDAAVKHTGLPREVFFNKTATEVDPNIFQTPYGKICLQTLETGEPSLSQYYLEITGRWQELTISKMDDDHLIHIFSDVTPVKEAQLQLERTVEELKRSNTNLEDFAYAASHDLKEPIRKVKTFTDRLKYALGDRLLEKDMHYFDRMEKATERMQYLIDDLLEYSHVSTSTTYTDEIDLNKKVAQVLEDLEVEVEKKQAVITIDPLPVVNGHRRQIQQVFQNLITNALKFSKPGVTPEIRITSTITTGENIPFTLPEELKSKRYNLIQISDNGIGFEQEYADTIFKMFQRLHAKAEYEGTGIGLAIVRKVIENHKGFIKAESKPGEGATFKIFLPIE